jgi:hypothetical protein
MGGDPSPPPHLPNVGAVCLFKLGRPDGGRVTHGVGDGIELAAVVAIGNPDGLTVTESGGRRETHRVGVGCFGILQGQGAGVNTPATPKIPPCLRGRERCRSQCGSHPTDYAPLLPGRRLTSGWFRSQGWCNSRGSQRRSSVGVGCLSIVAGQIPRRPISAFTISKAASSSKSTASISRQQRSASDRASMVER